MSMSPLELAVEIRPESRFHVVDVRDRARALFGNALERYRNCLYVSPHTTAGYLPPSLGNRLAADPQQLAGYVECFQAVFPPDAGYSHDKLELRSDLAPAQRLVEPTNADSHLTFMSSGLRTCVSYPTRRPGPVYFIDLDGVNGATPRRRVTTLVGYDHEDEVGRLTLQVPVSVHPIEAVNLKDRGLGLSAALSELIAAHGVTTGRVRLELASSERDASLTVNEYETLLMQHDLTEVLRNPLRFAAEKAKHAWSDPRTLPVKAVDYAKYDLVHAVNRLMDALGLSASRVEQLLARALEGPASRLLRLKRSVNLLVSDREIPGRGTVVEGTFQAPILIQWKSPARGVRAVDVVLTRFR
jgi:hypothetical protein